MDKRNKMSIMLDNGIIAWIADKGETLCLRMPNEHTWDVNIGDWETSALLVFLKMVGDMSSDSVHMAFQYDDVFNVGIIMALSKARANKIFDTGCVHMEDLARELIYKNAFGKLWCVVADSICIDDMATLLGTQDWVYRDGNRLRGGYLDTPDGIIGYIDE